MRKAPSALRNSRSNFPANHEVGSQLPSKQMPNTPTGSNTSSSLGDKISDVASQAKSKASDMGRTVVDKLDDNRDAAAGGIESAAAKLHSSAASLPGGPKVADAAHAAANKLSSTADYIRENDVSSMMSDLQQLVKNNPGPALLGAAFIGFLVARTFSNDD